MHDIDRTQLEYTGENPSFEEEFEFEGEYTAEGGVLTEADEYELASELLGVASEEELDQFLGSLIGDHAKTGIGTRLSTGTVIGAGANRTMTSRMLTQFIEKTGIPFVSTQLGKGVVDETHEKFVGCAALSAGLISVSIMPRPSEDRSPPRSSSG